MKTLFLIFIADIIRQGVFPRVDPFTYNKEFDKYLFSGRPLTLEEFNAASKRVFSPDFRGDGFTFRPQVIEIDPEAEAAAQAAQEAAAADAEAAKAVAADIAAARKAAETDETKTEEDPVTETPEATAADFRLDGKDIFQGEIRVGGLFAPDNHLRVPATHKELRPAIEEWLKSNPPE